MKIIEDLELIKKYQLKLKSKFFFSADKRPKPLLPWKAPIGKFAYEVNYVSNYRIWGCYISDPHNSLQHWNGFGVGEPTRGKAATIDLTITFNSSKEDLTQNAVFVENAEGEVLICHTGDISRIKDLFWEKYSGEMIQGEYADGSTEKLAYVSNMDDSDCLKEIATFVKLVKVFKQKKKKK